MTLARLEGEGRVAMALVEAVAGEPVEDKDVGVIKQGELEEQQYQEPQEH